MILPAFIDRIRFNKNYNNYTLTLKNEVDNSLFSLTINSYEAKKISLAKSGVSSNKLGVYDIFINLLTILNASIDKIKIIKNKNNVYAQIIFKINKKKFILDASIVDALILSLKTLSSIYIQESLFDKSNNIKYVECDNLIKNNPADHLDKLTLSLKKLVENENFESAAIIRDRILDLKKKMK